MGLYAIEWNRNSRCIIKWMIVFNLKGSSPLYTRSASNRLTDFILFMHENQYSKVKARSLNFLLLKIYFYWYFVSATLKKSCIYRIEKFDTIKVKGRIKWRIYFCVDGKSFRYGIIIIFCNFFKFYCSGKFCSMKWFWVGKTWLDFKEFNFVTL